MIGQPDTAYLHALLRLPGNGALHRIVYRSRSRISGPGDQVAWSMRRILDTSRRNNQRLGVTGAIMFNASSFGQVLEGPFDAVTCTFDRIRHDPRHADITLLSSSPAEARAFGRWAMASLGGTDRNPLRVSSIAADRGYDPAQMSGEALLAALRALAEQAETLEA